jgi:hypothetical protein
LTPVKIEALGSMPKLQVYNGLDTMITTEVFEEILSTVNGQPPAVYDFERAIQAPLLEMMLRGFKVDQYERRKGVTKLKADLEFLDGVYDEKGRLLRPGVLQQYALAVWDRPLNPRSPKQLIEFFYRTMGLPEQWISQKGVKKLSTNRETLEKLELYFHAMPIVAAILAIRDVSKKLSVLETEVDPDGRMRTSYNIGGTETWRLSSSSNAFGTGTNLQNITAELRKIFVADPGWKLCGIDLEQAESREVGWQCGVLFDDWSYLDACYSGDLHTTVCRMNWKALPWTVDAKADKALAETPAYRHFTYRDLAKKLGHGCLTADHEVLTRNGWVSITEKPNEIMTWSPFGSQFASVSNWIDKPYSGTMVKVFGNSLSLDMTGDHRVIYYKDPRWAPIEVPAEQFPKRGQIPLGGGFCGGAQGPSEAEARLIAAFQCDGHQKSKTQVEFHFKKERKFARLSQLCLAAGYQFAQNHHNKIIVEAGGWPKNAGAYLLTWSSAALLAYIEEHKYWDGHISATAQCIFSTKPEHLEWLQTIGRLLGIGGAFQKPNLSGFGSIVHKLQQNNRKFANIASLNISQRHDTCQVYCPTVPSGAFYVRHKGRISVTGNSNYYGTPWTMARHAKVVVKMVEEFQRGYFEAFPGIPQWHRWCAQQLQTTGSITNVWGATRHFFGRANDDSTLREAIAFGPQSATAIRMNLGLWKLWKHLGTTIRLIAQVHDAVYFLYPPELEDIIIPQALSLIDIRLTHPPTGRQLIVPGEAKVGWNWGNFDENKNPDGLKKWKGPNSDNRARISGLDRIL